MCKYIVLFLFVVGASLVSAQESLLFTIGSTGSGEAEFSEPNGIAVDDSGNIYVTDGGNNRVQVFDSHGNFSFEFGQHGEGDGELWLPYGIAVNSTGNIFVTDGSNGRVQAFDPDGNHLFTFGEESLAFPSGIAIDADDRIFVAYYWLSSIRVFDSAGNFLFSFGGPDASDGEVSLPRHIALDKDGNVYVVSSHNNRVQVFSREGEPLFGFGSEGTGDGQFNSPGGITIDTTGNIWVADTNNQRIQIFDSTGAFVHEFGSAGPAEGQFAGPDGMASDNMDHILIVDHFNNRIQVFDGASLLEGGSTNEGEAVALTVENGSIFARICAVLVEPSQAPEQAQTFTFPELAIGDTETVEFTSGQYSIELLDCDGETLYRWEDIYITGLLTLKMSMDMSAPGSVEFGTLAIVNNSLDKICIISFVPPGTADEDRTNDMIDFLELEVGQTKNYLIERGLYDVRLQGCDLARSELFFEEAVEVDELRTIVYGDPFARDYYTVTIVNDSDIDICGAIIAPAGTESDELTEDMIYILEIGSGERTAIQVGHGIKDVVLFDCNGEPLFWWPRVSIDRDGTLTYTGSE